MDHARIESRIPANQGSRSVEAFQQNIEGKHQHDCFKSIIIELISIHENYNGCLSSFPMHLRNKNNYYSPYLFSAFLTEFKVTYLMIKFNDCVILCGVVFD